MLFLSFVFILFLCYFNFIFIFITQSLGFQNGQTRRKQHISYNLAAVESFVSGNGQYKEPSYILIQRSFPHLVTMK